MALQYRYEIMPGGDCGGIGKIPFCHFVKVSNESLHTALACTKIRGGEKNGPSRAIRKIHFVAVCVDVVSCCWIVCLMADGMNVYW